MAATNHSPVDRSQKNRIDESLARLSGCLTNTDDCHWSYRYPGERKERTTIRVERNWVVVERPLASFNLSYQARMSRRIWSLLDVGILSVTGARAVLPVADNRVRIRAEIPFSAHSADESERLARWLETACAEARSWTRARNDAQGILAEKQAPAKATEIDIPALCEMAGWPATVRSRSGEAVVALPVRDDAICQVMVTQQPGFVQFQLPLEMTGDRELTPASQLAVGIALLRVAGEVRLVRATALRINGRLSTALDVRLPTPVSSENINHALSALALAQSQIALELDLLANDDFLARAYLTMQSVA